MTMQIPIKATADGVAYASKSPYEWEGKQYEPDIQNGDIITIKDEGTTETGQYGEQFYFKIETRNGIKKAPFNQSSLNVLAGEWGQESAAWVGKQVKVLTQKTVIAGERRIKAYFVTEGWYLDEWGDLVKDVVKDIQIAEEPETAQAPVASNPSPYPPFPGAPTV